MVIKELWPGYALSGAFYSVNINLSVYSGWQTTVCNGVAVSKRPQTYHIFLCHHFLLLICRHNRDTDWYIRLYNLSPRLFHCLKVIAHSVWTKLQCKMQIDYAHTFCKWTMHTKLKLYTSVLFVHLVSNGVSQL